MKINYDSIINSRLTNSNIEKKADNLDDKEDKELLEVCREFESLFLYMMMKEMKKNIPQGGLIEKSHASDIFEDMYLDEMSKEISKNDQGIGLAKDMYYQLKQDRNIVIK